MTRLGWQQTQDIWEGIRKGALLFCARAVSGVDGKAEEGGEVASKERCRVLATDGMGSLLEMKGDGATYDSRPLATPSAIINSQPHAT